MSIPFVLWILYHLVAVPMALWSATAAFAEGTGRGGRHRVATAAAGIGLPLALAGTVLGARGDVDGLRWALAALAPLTLATTWANVLALHGRSPLARLVQLPVLLWNAALCCAYGIRALQDLAGIDGGEFGATWTAGHALLQGWIGGPDAAVAPWWLHLPLCVPVGPRPGWMHKLALVTCGVTASLALAALALAMPAAQERAALFRTPVEDPPPLRADQVLGVRTQVADPGDALAALGARALVVDVDAALFDDPGRVAALRTTLDGARANGARLVAIARPPANIDRHPAPDVAALAEQMAKVHWLAAEQLDPDLLVLYSGPYASLRGATARVGSIEAWVAAARRGTDDVRVANPRVRTALAIESRAPHARRLFERLADGGSPLAAVALVGAADGAPPAMALGTFDGFEGWLEEHPVARPVWLLDVGAPVATAGGEFGQWAFVARGLAFAARRPEIVGVCLRALDDAHGRQDGLRAPAARPRLAFRELAARAGGATEPATPR